MFPFAEAEDERKILRAHYEYARALDERDWDTLHHVFAHECNARYGDGPLLVGRRSVIASIRGFLDSCGPTQHLISNVMVSRGDHVLTSRAAVRAVHRARSDEATFTSFATYFASWVKTAEGWRARDWRMVIQFNDGEISVLDKDRPRPVV